MSLPRSRQDAAVDHELSTAATAVCRYLASRFPQRELTLLPAVPGPIYQRVPDFHIAPWGPQFETCPLPAGHARILWLLPITEAERDFKRDHGLEALEQRFDDAAIMPADPYRRSSSDPGTVWGRIHRHRRYRDPITLFRRGCRPAARYRGRQCGPRAPDSAPPAIPRTSRFLGSPAGSGRPGRW
ncbi:MAG: hypothetical protein HOV71_02375 [Hamadaea sp.]|nr:hypothetical protein [Hamadaea sp.]NUT05627.1 hypothetical protein [Hamadaea sp.]